MLEVALRLAAEVAVRVVGLDACGAAIARIRFGELGEFVVFAMDPSEDEEEEEADDDEEGDDRFDADIWGDSLRDLDL